MKRGGLLLGLSLFLFVFAWLNAVPAAAQDVDAPTSMPDAEQGQAIYAERCTVCHGPTGRGDGPQAAAAVNPPAPIGTTEYLRNSTPAAMFDVIRNGRQAAGMPPFGPSNSTPLSDDEIWSLIAAAYSFGTDAERIEAGADSFAANCASCHGEDGREIAASDLTDFAYWSGLSNQTVADLILIDEEHTFSLAEDEQWAVVDYARTFSYRFVDPAPQFAPIETVVISGQVSNGTSGDTVPAGLATTISIFDQFTIQQELTTTLDATGAYSITLENVQSDWAIISSVEFEGVNYTSGIAQATQTENELDLPVEIFESTSDPAVLAIEQIHIVLAFVDDFVEVAQLYAVSNTSLAVFVGEDGEVFNGTVALGLPAGARDINWERGLGGGQSFLPAPEIVQLGDGWSDTVPVRPGQGSHTLLVRYRLPYDGDLTLAHPVNYDVARMTMALPDIGVVVVEDDTWEARGSQTIADQQILNYAGASVSAGTPLRLTLAGQPTQILNTSGNPILVRDDNQEIIIGTLALVLAAIGGVLLMRRWQNAPALTSQPDVDGLLDALADLDDAYEAGEIPAGRYERQRERLKERLRDAWE